MPKKKPQTALDSLFVESDVQMEMISELTCPQKGLIKVGQYFQLPEEEKKREVESTRRYFAHRGTDGLRKSADSIVLDFQNSLNERLSYSEVIMHPDSGMQITSYLRPDEKNGLALFFELPKNPINIGDTWDLDVDLLAEWRYGCDSSFYRHEVRCKEIKGVGKEQVAVINYDFQEYCWGATKVKFHSFQGEAEFSIAQGRWLQYQGIVATQIPSFLGFSETRHRFVLKIESPKN